MGRAIHPRDTSHTIPPFQQWQQPPPLSFRKDCFSTLAQTSVSVLLLSPVPTISFSQSWPCRHRLFFVHSAVARGTAEHLSASPQTPTLHDDVLQTTAYTLEKDNQAVTGLLLLPRCWTSLFLLFQNSRKAAGTVILYKATAGSTHQVFSDLQLGDCCNICNCLVSVGFISPLTKIPLLFSFIESWSSF